MLDAEQVAANVAGMTAQLERFLDFEGPRGATVVDNSQWLGQLGLIEFLRDIGKHFTVNQMIVRDSVKPRLDDPDRSISYTEFSYMLLQAYDYLALHDRHGCTLQVGGSDQWGNIVSGCDLIRRKRQVVVHGVTMPLVTRADGKKFGKSERGNVWLDPDLTSSYEFYQFWLNTDDGDVGRSLRYFTFLSLAEIAELEAASAAAPEKREAQRVLAAEVTRLVHGEAALARAQRTTEVLFAGGGSGDWRELSAQQLAEAFASSPRSQRSRSALGTAEAGLVAVVADSELSPSRGQARKAIESGGIRVNNVVVKDSQKILGTEDLIADRYIVLRRGKKAYHVVDFGVEGEGA
jgi:tyrosyl-tRNA synthetase